MLAREGVLVAKLLTASLALSMRSGTRALTHTIVVAQYTDFLIAWQHATRVVVAREKCPLQGREETLLLTSNAGKKNSAERTCAMPSSVWDWWRWILNCHVLDSKPFVKMPHFGDDVPMDISQRKQVGANSIHTELLQRAENTWSQRLCKIILFVYWFKAIENGKRWLFAQLWKQKARLYIKIDRVFFFLVWHEDYVWYFILIW